MEWKREETPDGITWTIRLKQFGPYPEYPPQEPGYTKREVTHTKLDAGGLITIRDTREDEDVTHG